MYEEVKIWYGSQTGTAAEASVGVYQECRARGLPASIAPLSVDCLPQPRPCLLIILISTTGDGLPPTPTLPFWSQLMSASFPPLPHTEFTVFGLGDSAYQHFNVAARKLWARLTQLGAVSFYRKGLGDDQHDFEYEGELDPWLATLWPELAKRLPTIPPLLTPPTPWVISPCQAALSTPPLRGQYSGVIVEKRMVTDGNPTVFSVKIATTAGYSLGDVCDLYPETDPAVVSQLATLLALDQSSVVTVGMNPESGLPYSYTPLHYQHCCSRHHDCRRTARKVV